MSSKTLTENDLCPTCKTLKKKTFGIIQCNGCKCKFCLHHIVTHKQEIVQNLNPILANFAKVKQELLDSQDPSDKISNDEQDILFQIDQWEEQMFKKIKETADRARECFNTLKNQSMNDMKHKFQMINEELNSRINNDNLLEPDVYCLKNKVEQLKLEIDQLLLTSKTNNIRINIKQSDQIDWTTMVRVYKNVQLCFDQLKMTQIKSISYTKKVSGMASSENVLLYSEGNEKLCLVDRTGTQKQTAIEWKYGSIKDICWSSILNQFIIITTKQVFTVEITTMTINIISQLKPLDNHEFGTCDCSENKLLLAYREDGSPLDQYRINDWQLEKRWPLFTLNDYVKCIRFMNDKQVALVIVKYGRSHDGYTLNVQNLFQIRDRLTMNIIRTHEDFKVINLICLSHNRYLTLQRDSLLIIDENGDIKRNVTYGKQIKYAVVVGKDCLVIKTDNDHTLEFYELSS
ncbi:unnamed protein product [Didymodactylos carnosus]|uniref:B box-type domain-containing protein n=1 Tax=Didymodactylos carnosus TaxID=1234261 RepID=A0A813VKQ2_9BILA|nr:unnamed protein product [Didymodactylos carnosus]CAF0842106.1 unnamed protein product [Didymodactylos carnosus]CAF3558046.1 unnamed protein product [Didymodactylos carnosus]CAF3629434.1 unnamed protein product [Didymodactylos carnosus]